MYNCTGKAKDRIYDICSWPTIQAWPDPPCDHPTKMNTIRKRSRSLVELNLVKNDASKKLSIQRLKVSAIVEPDLDPRTDMPLPVILMIVMTQTEFLNSVYLNLQLHVW